MVEPFSPFAIMWTVILLAGVLLSLLFMFFRRQTRTGYSLGFLGLGVFVGVGVAYLFFTAWKKEYTTNTNITTVTERLEKVFKVVSAEGHFSEVYQYENTAQVLSFIPSTKKALIMANAKVLMGFDMKKLKWEYDENNHKLRILEFPEPEILSVEPDLRYYNLENGLFNKFDANDLTGLQADAKRKLTAAALQSELPATARNQMKVLFSEMAAMLHVEIEGVEKISNTPALP